MILLLLPLLLQSKLHINTLPITHPAPNLAYLFRTLNLTHCLLNTSNPPWPVIVGFAYPSPCLEDRHSPFAQINELT